MHDIEAAEAEAFADMFAAAPAALAAEHGIAAARLSGGGICCKASSLAGDRTFNRATGMPGVSASTQEEIEAFFAGGPHVVSLPGAQPGAELLQAAGYKPDYAWMKFRRGTGGGTTPSSELQVRAVGKEQAWDFGSTVAAGFGMPAWAAGWLAALPGRAGWTCLVAYEGSAPAAAWTAEMAA